jgi:acyl-CoA-binding protein
MFQKALHHFNSGKILSHTIPDEIKLKLYALYKQATVGPNHEKEPTDFIAQLKWYIQLTCRCEV